VAVATASVTLTRAWLMDPADPTHPIVAGSTGSVGGGSRSNTKTQDGDFRQYVGRVRMIVRENEVGVYTIALRQLTKDQADLLESWSGRVLLLRDVYGRRIWGGFLSTTRLDYLGGKGLCDVGFTFTEITYSDEV
jgi:hypothetical protein